MGDIYLEPGYFCPVSKSFEGGRSKQCRFCLEYIKYTHITKVQRTMLIAMLALFAVSSLHYSSDSRNYVHRADQTDQMKYTE